LEITGEKNGKLDQEIGVKVLAYENVNLKILVLLNLAQWRLLLKSGLASPCMGP